MNDDNDFFSDVFEDPDDDPLLDGSANPSEESGSETRDRPTEPDRHGPPSWMSDEPERNGTANASEGREESDPTRKQIVVDQQGDAGAGIDAVNQAVGQGWRLVRISLARPDGEQGTPPQAAHRFVAILEQDNPQSLFDFGGAS